MSLGLNITAAKFNLRSYELWPRKLQLTWDDPVLKNFVGESAVNVHIYLGLMLIYANFNWHAQTMDSTYKNYPK